MKRNRKVAQTSKRIWARTTLHGANPTTRDRGIPARPAPRCRAHVVQRPCVTSAPPCVQILTAEVTEFDVQRRCSSASSMGCSDSQIYDEMRHAGAHTPIPTTHPRHTAPVQHDCAGIFEVCIKNVRGAKCARVRRFGPVHAKKRFDPASALVPGHTIYDATLRRAGGPL